MKEIFDLKYRRRQFVKMLEGEHLIASSDWADVVPKNVLSKLFNDGLPEAIARHPEYGWFVLFCGEYPDIFWSNMYRCDGEIRMVVDEWWCTHYIRCKNL